MLGLGKGKARGSKGGGLQAFNQWRTIALTTGEQPLSTSSSTAGIKTRALELYGVPISDEQLASKMHGLTQETYGTAGPLFVQKLIELAHKDDGAIKREYEEFKQVLSEQFADNISSHVQAVATVALADFYSSQWIFGLSQEDAAAQAIGLAEIIIGQLETAADADDGLRAYEYLMSWYAMNIAAFNGNSLQIYGRLDPLKPDVLLILPPAFDSAMQEGGFNPDRILRDWADRGWIEVQIRGSEDKRRLKIRKRVDGKITSFVAVRLDVLE